MPSLALSFFFFYCSVHLPDLHSFPTRRSSDLFRRRPLHHLLELFDRGLQPFDDGLPLICDPLSLESLAFRFGLGLHRSEEHTSELQSRGHLVCRLLLEKKNNI